MLIDQFTEEQLIQIRRELRERQQLSKYTISEETWAKLDELFDHKSYSDQTLFPYRSVGDAICVIADFTTDNFIYKRQGKAKKQIGWYRAQSVPNEKEEEYKQIIKDILEVISKHRKQKECPLKRPV